MGVLSEQSERQSRRIKDLEKMIAAKKDMLRHTEQVISFFEYFRIYYIKANMVEENEIAYLVV